MSSQHRPLSLAAGIDLSTRGGWGKTLNEPHGGIAGHLFPRSSQISHYGKTRILAVVGTNDVDHDAAPKKDGWFISDFFFLQHVFKNVAAPEDQMWLTCLDPRDLIKNYKEYAHGNPKDDHRKIVLDRGLVSKAKDSVSIIPSNDLRDRYLRILKEWTSRAVTTGEHILTILLCHGEESINEDGTCRIRFVLGGSHSKDIATLTNRLDLEQLTRSITPGSKVTIITSACHSGVWLQSPLMPNISMLAATPPDYESISWPLTKSNRACGGRYISGITDSVLRLNIPDITLIEGDQDELEKGAIASEGPSYATLASVIYDVMAEYDPRENMYPTSSARDDNWGLHWTEISGIRDEDIQARIDELRSVSRSPSLKDCPSSTGSVRSFEAGTMAPQVEYEVGRSLAKRLAYQYLTSHPGPSCAAKNISLSTSCAELLRGEDMTPHEVQKALHTLQYRLEDIMLAATRYKKYLGSEFPDCEQWDKEEWLRGLRYRLDGDELRNIYKGLYWKLQSARLFFQPKGVMNYDKGINYLAAVLAERHVNSGSVDATIKLWQALRDEKGEIAAAIRKFDLSRHRKIRSALQTIAGRVRKRVRELSPRKKSHRRSVA